MTYSTLTRCLSIVTVFLISCSVLHADITVSISFSDTEVQSALEIAEGTSTVNGFLFFESSDGTRGSDAGAEFDAFSYAIEATNSGVASLAFAKPITTGNLNAVMRTQDWSIADQSLDIGLNQLAGNVNAPQDSGLSLPFGVAALSFTLDTSDLASGDVVQFNPNLANFASISSGADDFGGNGNYVFNNGSISVSAIPEPASILVLMGCAIPLMLTRKRAL